MIPVLANIPFNSPLAPWAALFFGSIVTTLIVAAFVSRCGKRYVPLSRRKGTKANTRLKEHLALIRERKEGHGIFRREERAVRAGDMETPDHSNAPVKPSPLLRRAFIRAGRSRISPPWISFVLNWGALFLLLMGVMAVFFGAAMENATVEALFSLPTVLSIFFVSLFAAEFLPFAKLKYALFASIPVGGLVVLGFFVDLLTIWPIVLVFLCVATLAVAVIVGIREKSFSFWRAWGRKLRGNTEVGEATGRVLGRPDPRFDNARPGRHLRPAKESRAEGMYWRMP
ncbi:MAG: hypothetical protein ACYTFG_12765 [Planctomycetota bacterium]|jgi:hypothetical protein